jgi:hypothetical protein
MNGQPVVNLGAALADLRALLAVPTAILSPALVFRLDPFAVGAVRLVVVDSRVGRGDRVVRRARGHCGLLSRGLCGSHPCQRTCNEPPYLEGARRVGRDDPNRRFRADPSGTLPVAPVGVAWFVLLLVDGGPGASPGHRFFLRRERKAARIVECLREPGEHREVGVECDPVCAAYLERGEAVFGLSRPNSRSTAARRR